MVDLMARNQVFRPTTFGPLRRFPADYPHPGEVYAPVWEGSDFRVPCVALGDEHATARILLFHGNADTVLHIRPVARALAARCEARVFVIEFPGFWLDEGGRARRPSAAGLYEAGRVAGAILAEAAPFHVMGYSLGSACAVRCAATFPESVLSLTLLAPLCSALSVVAAAGGPFTLMAVLKPVLAPFVDAFRADRDAQYVRAPALVLHGRADEVIPVTEGCRMAALLHAELEVLAGVTHASIVTNDAALRRVAAHVHAHPLMAPGGHPSVYSDYR